MANLLTERGWPFIFLPTTGVLSRWEYRHIGLIRLIKPICSITQMVYPTPLEERWGLPIWAILLTHPYPSPTEGEANNPP